MTNIRNNSIFPRFSSDILALGLIVLAAGASAACVTSEEPVDEGEAMDVYHLGDRASCGLARADSDGGGSGGGAAALRITVTDAEIDDALANSTVASNGLPKWQSRPGAAIALYLDFDGGTYDSTSYSAASLDSDKTRFNTEERRAILRAALELKKGYAGFNVNVTTDRTKMDDAYRWGWMVITNSWDSSGEAWIDVMDEKPTSEALAIAGTSGVLGASSIDRGYLITHEFGHNFGLNHSGRWVSGSFYEYEELQESRTGDWMGGRDSYFTNGYKWRDLQTEDSTSTQYSTKIVTQIAGRTDCSGSYPQCNSSCPCYLNEERDCDSNAECIDGLKCRQRDGADQCELP